MHEIVFHFRRFNERIFSLIYFSCFPLSRVSQMLFYASLKYFKRRKIECYRQVGISRDLLDFYELQPRKLFAIPLRHSRHSLDGGSGRISIYYRDSEKSKRKKCIEKLLSQLAETKIYVLRLRISCRALFFPLSPQITNYRDHLAPLFFSLYSEIVSQLPHFSDSAATIAF